GIALGPGPAGVVEHPARQQADQALQVRPRAAHRQVQGRYRVTEGVPARGQGLLEVAPLVVDLRDDHGARHPHRGALVPQHPGQAVHALGRGDSEKGRVRRAEPGPQVAGEVGVAGVSSRFTLTPPCTSGATVKLTERCCLISTSSKSLTVVPSSTRPMRWMTPVAVSSASTSVVFPEPQSPTITTFRTPPGWPAGAAPP